MKTAQELESAIAKGIFPTLCLLYGEESFLVERIASRLLDAAVPKDMRDFNLNVFYGKECKGIEILDSAQTLPMFADRRAVLVKQAEGLSAAALEHLSPYLSDPSPSTCLILCAAKIDQRRKFFLDFKKHGTMIEFKRLYDNKVAPFIVSEAMAQGRQFDGAAAELLAALAGNNLQELVTQIGKIITYAAGRKKITVDDVRAVASSSKAFTAFELAANLGARNLQTALQTLDSLFTHGEDTPLIIGALTNHFRQLWRIRELLDKRTPQSDIGKLVGINPYFLGDKIKQAEKFGRPELRKIFSELHNCDVMSKTGGHPYTLMHSLAFTICTGGNG